MTLYKQSLQSSEGSRLVYTINKQRWSLPKPRLTRRIETQAVAVAGSYVKRVLGKGLSIIQKGLQSWRTQI